MGAEDPRQIEVLAQDLPRFWEAQLAVMAIERGGCWSDEAAEMIRLLSHAEAREHLRTCVARWR